MDKAKLQLPPQCRQLFSYVTSLDWPLQSQLVLSKASSSQSDFSAGFDFVLRVLPSVWAFVWNPSMVFKRSALRGWRDGQQWTGCTLAEHQCSVLSTCTREGSHNSETPGPGDLTPSIASVAPTQKCEHTDKHSCMSKTWLRWCIIKLCAFVSNMFNNGVLFSLLFTRFSLPLITLIWKWLSEAWSYASVSQQFGYWDGRITTSLGYTVTGRSARDRRQNHVTNKQQSNKWTNEEQKSKRTKQNEWIG